MPTALRTMYIFILLVFVIMLNPQHADARRAVRVGIYNFKPMVYADTDGSSHGFVDILNHVAKKENWDMQYVPGTWQEGLERLKNDQIDLILCVGYTEGRDKVMDFPKEFLLLDWGLVYKAKGSTINTIMDLNGKSVSVLKGSVFATGFQELVKQFNIHVQILEMNQVSDVFTAVDSKKAEAGVTANISGILNEAGHSVERTSIIFSPVKLGYAVNQNKNSDLIAALDREIAVLKADQASIYHQKLEKLLGKKGTTIPKEAYWILTAVVVVLLLAIAFIVLLKRQVKEKTEHLEAETDERKKAEELIKASEEQLRAIMDNTDSVIYMKDIESKYITINRRFEELFKVSRTDVLGKTDYDIFPAEIAAVFKESDHTVLNLGKPLSLEEIAPQDDGYHTYASVKFPLFGADGRPFAVCGISNDITERKKAEVALAESEYRWKFALEGARDGVWDWNIQTGEAFYSQRYKEMLGFTENEIGNTSDEWLKRIHPEDAPVVMTALQPYLDGKAGSPRVEFRMMSKDGSWKWIVGRGMIVSRDSDGIPLRMIGTNTDITERKSEEEQIKSLTQRLLLATSSALLGVWDWNVKENTMVWDDRMFELYGITRDAFPSNIDAWMNGLHPEDKETAIAECQAALKGEKEFDTVFRVLQSDGTVKHLKANGLVIRGTDGCAERMLGINVDITEIKHAEKTLRESEERFKKMFRNHSAVMLLIEPESGVIIDANQAAEEFYGYSHEGLLSINISHINTLSPELIAAERHAAIEEKRNHFIFPHRLSDGTIRTVEAYSTPITVNNSTVLFSIVQDITERKKAEQELLAKNTQMERFTYTVSHDLKSPLITIQTYAGMILKDMEAGRHERAMGDMKRIEDAAGKMNALLGDLLELSRVGRQMNDFSLIDMNRLVKDTLSQLAGPIMENRVEMVVQPDLPTLHGDHIRIAEVVQNLIENAIKYRGDQEAPRIEIGARQEGKEIIFHVKDNGKGIDPRFHESIFGLFKKLDADSEGTGVGLALVKRIIEVHDGKVWVESEGEGKGSRFCFTIKEATK